MSNLKLHQEILRCTCHSKEHEIEFAYDDEFFYGIIHLKPLPFFQRLKHAIKYIFGYRCAYGDFEEMLFDQSEMKKLTELIYTYSYNNKHFMEGEKTVVKGQEVDLV